jgi:hypothetical protein
MPIIIDELVTEIVPDNTGVGPEGTLQPTGEVSTETLFDHLALAREREARLAVD